MRPVLDVGLTALAFGSGIVAVRAGLASAQPGSVILVRTGLASALLALLLLANGRILSTLRGRLRAVAFTSVVTVVIPIMAFAYALRDISAANLGILLVLRPLLTVGIGIAAFHTGPPRRGVLVGMSVGFVGAALLIIEAGTNRPSGAGAGSAVIGHLIAVSGVLSAAVGGLVIQTRLAACDLRAVTSAQVTIAFVAFIAIAPWLGWPDQVSATPTSAWPALIYSGVIGTGAAYLLLVTAVRRHGAVVASTAAYLEPVLIVALGAVVLEEPFTIPMLLAAALAGAGVVISHTSIKGLTGIWRRPA